MPEIIPSCAAGVPIFRVLPPEGLAALGEAMHHRHFAKGELVAAAGEPVEHLIVVAHGRLKAVHTTASGREQVVRTLCPGEFLGEMALFAPARHEGDLVALEDSDTCLVSRRAVQAILARYPETSVRLVQALAERLAETEQLVADLGLRDVGQRLAAELHRLAEKAPPESGARKVHLSLPWSELAVRLGTTPESLSRRLKALQAQGIVAQKSARTLLILDPERLRRLAQV